MNAKFATMIGKKAMSLKHCDKILDTVEKKGRVDITLNNTGVTLPCVKGDALHTLIQSIKYKLVHEINAITVVETAAPAEIPVTRARAIPAPVGACEDGIHICSQCGKEFTSSNPRAKTCSSECRRSAYLEYQKSYNKRRDKSK